MTDVLCARSFLVGTTSAVVATVLGAGCGGPALPTSSPDVVATGWQSADGVELVMACTPSGPELCFNAVDDNCNGVLDEGCGSCTGPLQFAIAWAEPRVDVDLSVLEPSGARASATTRTTPSGLHYEVNCPKDGCQGQNLENVCLVDTDPPRGRYTIEVHLHPETASGPVRVRVGGRVGRRTFGASVELTADAEKRTFSFEL